MKGAICYFSTTDNTKLVCGFLRRQMKRIDIDLVDIVKDKDIDLNGYDLLGFATFTDQMRVPRLMKKFISDHRTDKHKPSFILNTYGCMSGSALLELKRIVSRNGFVVLSGISVHTPENYPPMIKGGFAFNEEPSDVEIEGLRTFVKDVDAKADLILHSQKAGKLKIEAGQYFMPLLPFFLSKKALGRIVCDAAKCVKCRVCEKNCPVQAITVGDAFACDHSKCQQCWSCYNNCAAKAIHGTNFKYDYQYREGRSAYVERLKALEG